MCNVLSYIHSCLQGKFLCADTCSQPSIVPYNLLVKRNYAVWRQVTLTNYIVQRAKKSCGTPPYMKTSTSQHRHFSPEDRDGMFLRNVGIYTDLPGAKTQNTWSVYLYTGANCGLDVGWNDVVCTMQINTPIKVCHRRLLHLGAS